MPKEPFNGPVIEMFHENDYDEEVEKTPTESFTGSSASSRSSRESGVESMEEIEQIELTDKKEISGLADLEQIEEENEKEDDLSHPSPSTDDHERNDIDSPFEVFNTVYV